MQKSRYMNRLNRAVRILKYRLHTYLGKSPRIVFPLYALTGVHEKRTVSRSSRLLIEGFPRSATTFCSYAFLHAQAASLDIAVRIHVPAHVIRALRLGIPSLVLIRPPRDAVSSLALREPGIPVAVFLERYWVFYETLEPYREHFVTAGFAEAISDFGAVIDRINAKFGVSFCRFEHTESNIAAVYDKLDERQRLWGGGVMTSYRFHKAKELAKKYVDFSAHREALERCETVYARWSG